MHLELTIKEYAERERVSDRTVRRWIEKGAVEVRRTPGGRVRICPQVIILRTNTDTRGQSDR
jgi:excisionase family DNA binding protein